MSRPRPPPPPPPRPRSLQHLRTASTPNLSTLFSGSQTYPSIQRPASTSPRVSLPLPPHPPQRHRSLSPTPSPREVTNPFRNPTLLQQKSRGDVPLPPSVAPSPEWWEKAAGMTDVGVKSELAYLRRKSIAAGVGATPYVPPPAPPTPPTPPPTSPAPIYATNPMTALSVPIPSIAHIPRRRAPPPPPVPVVLARGGGVTLVLCPPTPSPPSTPTVERRMSEVLRERGKEWWEIETKEERAAREEREKAEGKWLEVPVLEEEEEEEGLEGEEGEVLGPSESPVEEEMTWEEWDEMLRVEEEEARAVKERLFGKVENDG